MKLSRIDIIGQNGNDGLHYEEPDILDRLRATTKVNGAYPKDIADAIAEIEDLRYWQFLAFEAYPNIDLDIERVKGMIA